MGNREKAIQLVTLALLRQTNSTFDDIDLSMKLEPFPNGFGINEPAKLEKVLKHIKEQAMKDFNVRLDLGLHDADKVRHKTAMDLITLVEQRLSHSTSW